MLKGSICCRCCFYWNSFTELTEANSMSSKLATNMNSKSNHQYLRFTRCSGPSGQHKVRHAQGQGPSARIHVAKLRPQDAKILQLVVWINGRKQIFACPFRCSKEVEDHSMTQWTNTGTSRYARTSKKSLKIPIPEICHFYGTKFLHVEIFTKKCVDL